MRKRALLVSMAALAMLVGPHHDVEASRTQPAAQAASAPVESKRSKSHTTPSLARLCCAASVPAAQRKTAWSGSWMLTVRGKDVAPATTAATPCLVQCARLARWVDQGITFVGPWTADEASLVTETLDRFAGTLGKERFDALMEAAIVTATGGRELHLTFVRSPADGAPPAGWMPSAGAIVINNGLFDDAYLNTYYNWGVLAGAAGQPPAGITIQQAIIGHELGHVLIDGLQAEMDAAMLPELPLESLYVEAIPRSEWAHVNAPPNESLATELALWAYGISRPAQAEAFLQHVLIAAIEDIRVVW